MASKYKRCLPANKDEVDKVPEGDARVNRLNRINCKRAGHQPSENIDYTKSMERRQSSSFAWLGVQPFGWSNKNCV